MRSPPRIVVASLLLALCSPLLQAQISVPPGGAGPGTGRPQKLKTPIPSVASLTATSPFDAEGAVALTRETIFTFDAPLDPSTVTPAAISAVFGGLQLDGWLKLSANAEVVTLFYFDPLPASSVILVTVNGDLLRAATGLRVDADDDGFPGGVETFVFSTISLTALADTAVCGRIFASELAIDGSGMSVNVPLVNAKISVDGAADTLFTFTDANGDYRLEPCPAGKFFVEVDGTNATSPVPPPGSYYPTVGKPFDPTPQQEVNMPDIYLPLVPVGTLQPVSTTSDVTVGFAPSVLASYPEFTNCSITVPAGSLFANDGTPGQMVGIAPVPPDKLPGPLPEQLDMGLVITVQTDGASNFDVPAPVVFPNVPFPADGYLPQPGEQFALWSFNHDTGNWEVVGPATVSADGLTVASDPGVGIKAPGWHGISPCPNQGLAPPAADPDCNTLQAIQDCWGPAFGAVLSCVTIAVPGATFVTSCTFAMFVMNANIAALISQHLNDAITNEQLASGIAAEVLKAAIGCAEGAAKELLKPVAVASCAIDLTTTLASCKAYYINCDEAAPSFLNAGDALDDAIAKLSIQSQRLETIISPFVQIFGDEVWFSGTDTEGQSQVFADWITAWSGFTGESSAESAKISISEESTLLALAYPEQLTAADVQAFLARWNLTIDYWNAGIFEVSQVPSGQETDFIDRAVIEDSTLAAIDALNANATLGFDSLYEGVASATSEAWLTLLDEDSQSTTKELYWCNDTLDAPGQNVQRGTGSGGGGFVNCCNGGSGGGGGGGGGGVTDITKYRYCVLDPATLTGGAMVFGTQGVGTVSTMLPVILAPSTQPDTDGDLLADDFEFTVGTQLNVFDTDNDGIGDGAELQNGTNPLDGLVAATGIIASVATPGSATCLDAFNDVAVVGSGNTVTVYNVFNGMDPLAIASVVPNPAASVVDVALDADRIAVALGSGGLAIIDIAEPSEAAVVYTIPQTVLGGPANAVAVAGGMAFVGAGGRVAAVDLGTGAVSDQAFLGQGIVDLFAYDNVLLALGTTTLFSLPLFDGLLDVADSVGFALAGKNITCDGQLAHVSNQSGYLTFGVDAGAQFTPLASYSNPLTVWTRFVTNGAGLGVALGLVVGAAEVVVYDTTDHSAPVPLGVFPLPGGGIDVGLYNGRAYVADGVAGLQVVNYLAYDSAGAEPGLAWSTSAGADVTEGELVHVPVTVIDDVQVRNVELWVEGEKAQTDGDAPYEFFVRASDVDRDGSWAVYVRASDTGGNASVTSPLVLPFVPDVTPPTVTLTLPAPGSSQIQFLLETIGFSFIFSESLAAGTLCDAAITATSAGADLLLGTGDDVLVGHACNMVAQDRRLIMTLSDLPVGSLRVRLDDLWLLDGAGNMLDGEPDGAAGGDYVLDIVVDATPERCWDVPFSGLWSGSRNWSGDLLPQSNERVAINVPSDITVIHAGEASAVVISLDCQEDFVLAGGTLAPAYFAIFAKDLVINGGTLGGGTTYLGGTGSWTSGGISGTLVVDAGASFDVGLGASFAGVIDNAGLLSLLPSSGLFLNGGRIHNLPGGLLDLQTNALDGNAFGRLENAGTLRRTTSIGACTVTAPVNNTGLVDVQTGGLRLVGPDSTYTGSFTVASGAYLEIGNEFGGQSIEQGSSIAGPGTLYLAGLPLGVNGDIPVETLGIVANTALNGGGPDPTLRVTGTGTWSSGILTGSGGLTLRVDPGVTMTLTGATATKGIGGSAVLEVAGTLVVQEGVMSTVTPTSEFFNLVGGLVDWRTNFDLGNTGPVTNAGTWRRSVGTGTSTVTAPFTNTGLVDVQTGGLQFFGPNSAHTGDFTVASGAFLVIGNESGGQSLEQGCSITGAGTLYLGGLPLGVNGDIPVETLAIVDNTALNGGGPDPTLRVTGSGTWTSSFFGSGTTLTGNGGLTLRVDPAATLSLVGNSVKGLSGDGAIEVAGTLVVQQGGLDAVTTTCEIRNLAGGVIDWRSEDDFYGTTAASFTNAGLLKRTTGATNIEIVPTITNTGTLRIETGAMQFNGSTFTQTAGAIELAGGVLVIAGSGTATLAGGSLTGSGSVFNSVVHSGSTVPGLSGPGLLNIAGNWTQTGSGTLVLELGGTTVGTQYDQLAVAGAATLAGTLSVSLINGFDPQLGDSFTVLTFGTRVGDFTTYTLPALGAGKKLQASFTATALVLTVVPDP